MPTEVEKLGLGSLDGVEVGFGKLGFSVQESVIVVLGQVHLLFSPEVREGAPEIQSPWIPEMLSLGPGG